MVSRYAWLLLVTAAVWAPGSALAQRADFNQAPDEERRQAESGRADAVPEVSFVPGAGTAEAAPKGRQSKGVHDTINGLRHAGYTLDIIVGFLKNSGCQASEISMACFHAGYGGADIVTSLKNAGFNERAAEDAVPRSLRSSGAEFPFSEQEMLGLANTAIITAAQGHDVMPLAIGQQSVLSGARQGTTARPPAGGGMTPRSQAQPGGFGGLGSWSHFQQERVKDKE